MLHPSSIPSECQHSLPRFSLFVNDDRLSPWTIFKPYPTKTACQLHSLAPTMLQLRTLHHLFIDVLASSKLRDSIFLAVLDDEHEEQLCYDLHSGGFVMWGIQPWNPIGWEVSQLIDGVIFYETVRFSNLICGC